MAVDLLAQLEYPMPVLKMAPVFSELRGDIESNRRELKTLIDRLHIIESLPRKATTWLTAKLAEIKLNIEAGHYVYSKV